MATIKAVLKREARKTDQTHLVMFRLTRDRKAVYIGTSIYVPKKDWNETGTLEKGNWIHKRNPNHDAYNKNIKEEWHKLDKLQLDHPELPVAQLKKLAGREAQDLMGFFKEEMLHLQQNWRPATIRTSECALKQLETFTKGVLPPLDTAFLKRYEAHLLKTMKRNSASRYLSFLKSLIRRAVDAGVIPYAENPFLSFKVRTGKVHKDRLTSEEIATIIKLKLEGKQEKARVAFLVQFFLSGMRISDLLQMRWEMIKGDRLEYKSQKTGTLLSVKIPPPALTLMGERQAKGHVFPFLPEGLSGVALRMRLVAITAMLNRELKKVATAAKIEKNLTTHVARHSFASLAWTNSKDIKAVSAALGHASLGMTENYLRELTHQEQDALSDTTFKDFV